MAPHDEHDTALARLLHEQQRLPLPLLQELLGEVRRGRAAGAGVSLAQLVVARGLLPAAVVEASQAAAARPVAPLAGRVPAQLGPYRLLRRLGAGGMGAVYEAEHTATGARHALKLLEQGAGADLQERFLREARAMAAVDAHPHVARIHASGEEQGWAWIAMELAPGGDLAGRIARGPLAPEAARALVADLADGLAFVHARGVLHRDLKPANVLFDGEGRALLTDFGLAKGVGERSLTQAGDLVGTPAYMAPEQALGLPLDARADVYALGAILFACLTGRAPYEGSALFELLERVVHEAPPSPAALVPAVPPDLDAVCVRALAKDPAARFADAAALAAALRAPPPASPPRRGAAKWLAAAGLALGVVAGALALLADGPPREGELPGEDPAESARRAAAAARAEAAAALAAAEAALVRCDPVAALRALEGRAGPETASLRVEALLLTDAHEEAARLLPAVAPDDREVLALALALVSGRPLEPAQVGRRPQLRLIERAEEAADPRARLRGPDLLPTLLSDARESVPSLPRPLARAVAGRLLEVLAWPAIWVGRKQLATTRAALVRLAELCPCGRGHTTACAAAAYGAARQALDTEGAEEARLWEEARRLCAAASAEYAATREAFVLAAVPMIADWNATARRGEPPGEALVASALRLAQRDVFSAFADDEWLIVWEPVVRRIAEVLVQGAWARRAEPERLHELAAAVERLIPDEGVIAGPELLLARVAGHLLLGQRERARALADAPVHGGDSSYLRLARAEAALSVGELDQAVRHARVLVGRDQLESFGLRIEAVVQAIGGERERALATLAAIEDPTRTIPLLPWRGQVETRRAIEAGWRPGTSLVDVLLRDD